MEQILSITVNERNSISKCLESVNQAILQSDGQVSGIISKYKNTLNTLNYSDYSTVQAEINEITVSLLDIRDMLYDPTDGISAQASALKLSLFEAENDCSSAKRNCDLVELLFQVVQCLADLEGFVESNSFIAASKAINEAMFVDFGFENDNIKRLRAYVHSRKQWLVDNLIDRIHKSITVTNMSIVVLEEMHPLFESADILGVLPLMFQSLLSLLKSTIFHTLLDGPFPSNVISMLCSAEKELYSTSNSNVVCDSISEQQLLYNEKSPNNSVYVAKELCLYETNIDRTLFSMSSLIFNSSCSFAEFLDNRYRCLCSVLSFITTTMLKTDSNFIGAFGMIFYPYFNKILLSEHIPRAVPSSSSSFSEFGVILKLFDSLFQSLHTIGIIDSPKDDSINSLLLNVNTLYADKLTLLLLAYGRKLIVSHNFDIFNQEAHPEVSIPAFPISDRPISKTCVDYIALIYYSLEECESCPDSSFVSVTKIPRELVFLWLAIFPSLHGVKFSTIPTLSMLFFNDCLFLAAHLQSASYIFYPKLTKRCNHSFPSFVDLISALRTLGSEYFNLQLANQRNNLLSEFDNCSSDITSIAQTSSFNSISQAINSSLYSLTLLIKSWKSVMEISPLQILVARLFDSLLLRIIFHIEAQLDIPVENATRLHELLTMIIESEFINNLLGITGLSKDHTLQLVPSWRKFKALLELLHPDQNLASITELENNESFVDFSFAELRGLICALFEESDKRGHCVSFIENKRFKEAD